MTSSYSSLTPALAEALVDVLWFIDGSEDEQMDQDDAVKVMEGVAHVVSMLSSDQQQELIALLGEMAAAETTQRDVSSWRSFRRASGSSTICPEGYAPQPLPKTAPRSSFRTARIPVDERGCRAVSQPTRASAAMAIR
ncbi:hypothetical protein [Streptomyces sp. NPDC005547]|uniref:hypothetical protein n=1 Tax=Streptomyces sp. NPDC005547 TaxID=3154887 RepID=UPI0033AD4F92